LSWHFFDPLSKVLQRPNGAKRSNLTGKYACKNGAGQNLDIFSEYQKVKMLQRRLTGQLVYTKKNNQLPSIALKCDNYNFIVNSGSF